MTPRSADVILMAEQPERTWGESPRASALRAKYRCTMCHKRCFIPCTLTASEFRQMEEGSMDGDLPDEALRGE